MKTVNEILNHIRQTTENNDPNGILDSEFLTWLNDAQTHLQSLIFQANPDQDYFTEIGYLPVNGSSEYSLRSLYNSESLTELEDTRMLTTGSLNNVELSSNTRSYFALKRISPKEARTSFGYWTRGSKISFNPSTTSGVSRITYTRKLDRLDKRRGQISAYTSGVSITLGVGTVPSDSIFDVNFISIVDSNGEPVLQNIPITGYNVATRVISTAKVLPAGLNGLFVVYGAYSAGISELDPICENYLITYTKLQTSFRDSSRDSNGFSAILQKIENEILKLYADNSADANYIPILTTDYLNY
jgi:hypothetical protein